MGTAVMAMLREEDVIAIDTWAVVIATFFGPVIAVLITRWNDRRTERRQRLLGIFRTLMATRRMTISQEHVAAINLIEVEFHGVQPVLDAWSVRLQMLLDNLSGVGTEGLAR